MSKFIKSLLQSELEAKLSSDNISEFLVISLKGLTGNQNNELRSELEAKGVKVLVVKNSLFRKALESKGMENAGELFEGPCAIAYGGDSVVDVAKEVVDWSKKIKKLEVRGAYTDGEVFDDKGAVELSKMPTRSELQGEVLMLVLSPARRVAGAAMGPAGIIAGCIKSIVDDAEKDAA